MLELSDALSIRYGHTQLRLPSASPGLIELRQALTERGIPTRPFHAYHWEQQGELWSGLALVGVLRLGAASVIAAFAWLAHSYPILAAGLLLVALVAFPWIVVRRVARFVASKRRA